MTDYVNAAFYADVKHELEVALMYHRENKEAVDALNKYIVEGRVPTDFTLLAKVGRAVATPFHTLGGLLKDHSMEISTDLVSARDSSIVSQLPPDPFGIRGRSADEKIMQYITDNRV